MARTKKEDKVEEVKSTNNNLNELSKLLDENKKDHYNYEEEVFYTISTGSLILDSEMNGGLCPGLHRFCGPLESGKTSMALECMRNFFLFHESTKNGKGLLIKTERLSKELQARSGIKFVSKMEDWVVGTCFILESNVYELVIDFLRVCVKDNPEQIRYFFLLDSMDGLMLRDDVDKPIEDSSKVAGTPSLSKKLLQKMSLALGKLGHIMVMISQISSQIKLDPYSKTEFRPTSSSGGNAISHWSNWILELEPRYNSTYILPDPNKPIDRLKNRPLGHYCKLTFKKSVNENTNLKVEYPVKYGSIGGSSVWKEYELVDFMLMNSLLKKGGAWFTPDESFKKELETAGFEVPEKIQGSDNIRIWLEKNPDTTDYLFKKFKDILSVKRL